MIYQADVQTYLSRMNKCRVDIARHHRLQRLPHFPRKGSIGVGGPWRSQCRLTPPTASILCRRSSACEGMGHEEPENFLETTSNCVFLEHKMWIMRCRLRSWGAKVKPELISKGKPMRTYSVIQDHLECVLSHRWNWRPKPWCPLFKLT